jgi:hypothetical protein
MSSFKLANSDIDSTTWSKVAKRLHERIEELRVANDNPLLDPVMTANTRGRIAELKLLLQAAEESPPPIDIA